LRLSHAIILAGAALLVFAACGGDGPGEPSPTATIPAGETGTPVPATATSEPSATATTTPTPVPPDPDLVRQLARSASYIIYTAAEGDTLPHVARVFGGVPGPDGTLVAFLAELQELNQLSGWDLEPGQIVAIPLLPESTGNSVLFEFVLAAWLTANGTNGLFFVWPSDRLVNDGYQGALTIQAIEVSLDEDTEQVVSYSLEFAETDRPVFKGGQLDPDAVVVGQAFRLDCGPGNFVLSPNANETAFSFGKCLVVAQRGELDAETIAGLLSSTVVN
jgi:hypothetical protein